ncbi:fimbria/pilus outer membrane usher protein [Serratia sp. JUb9]|uniref:fimbria/pilus outer membrane usher protein n=1 Tax=Serratia sp. JUb9 TaxID=2724469 RepID=UPI00164D4296|nr:fimbria/pilus outer membrane usher protein [Serratia sp. JUb9]QNK33087.1 fimbria/pilus outer membrane usher protein [Serratia sp. JUb9]
MSQQRFIISRIASAIIAVLVSWEANAVEFNTDVLDLEDRANIDFSRFSQAGYIMPGVYHMTLRINGESVGYEGDIPFYPRDYAPSDNNTSPAQPEACLPQEVVDRLGLTDKAAQQLARWHNGQCVDFSPLPGVALTPNLGSAALNINVPQALLEYTDASWLPPSRWDHGLPGFLLDYNITGTFTSNRHSGRRQTLSANGTLGMNLGAWRLRGDYQGRFSRSSSQQKSRHTLDFSRVYLYRPIPSLSSTLTIGENYVNSPMFDSWRYAGIAMASDERMLPPRLRGYAPEIIGIAKTNAKVTVTQQDRVIYETTVAAGPFRIQNLDSAIRGTMDVKVTEQDGEEHTFSLSTAAVPYLTRPGQLRYQAIVGRPTTWEHDLEGQLFASGEASWGLSNIWTLYGGSTLSADYQALALGSGRDLFGLGTVAVDVTQSVAKVRDNSKKQGKSWRLSYSKFFDEMKADVTFAGYRFSEKNYMSMQQFLDQRRLDYDPNHQKERYQINVNKSFDNVSLGLNYEHQTYWDRGSTKQYGANIGTTFDLPALKMRSASLTATAMRSQYRGQDENRFSLMLSLPMGTGTVSYNSSYNRGQYGHRIGYYDRLGLDSYNINAGVDHGGNQESRAQVSGMYTHNGARSKLSVNGAIDGAQYRSLGLSATGGITATPRGVAMHAGGNNGSTRLMVDTDGIGGVPINGGRVVSNAWGIGVVSDVNSYYRTTTRIDVSTLADDVEAKKSVVETALTDGAIGYQRFGLLQGSKAFATFRLADGGSPPFGAVVRNSKNQEVGIVGDAGIAWLSGITPKETLSLVWNDSVQCLAVLPSAINEQNLLLPCRRTAAAGAVTK